MTHERSIHVVFDAKSRLWAVTRQSALSSVASYASREKAVEEAVRIAQRERSSVVVHEADGSVSQTFEPGSAC